MSEQWVFLLKNCGDWCGEFVDISADGEVLGREDSLVRLEGLDGNQRVRQTISFPKKNESKVLEYGGLARSCLFFEDGAFSQGSLQFSPVAGFGAELGFIYSNFRMRVVELYDAGRLSRITLIREKLVSTSWVDRPSLRVDQLIGEWRGDAVTIYPDWRSPMVYATNLCVDYVDKNRVIQRLIMGEQRLESEGIIEGSRVVFANTRLLLLEDGVSVNCPWSVKLGRVFILEAGWLINPSLRYRMIRCYGDKGEWLSLTLVKEVKL